jgi:hypothetical protein
MSLRFGIGDSFGVIVGFRRALIAKADPLTQTFYHDTLRCQIRREHDWSPNHRRRRAAICCR